MIGLWRPVHAFVFILIPGWMSSSASSMRSSGQGTWYCHPCQVRFLSPPCMQLRFLINVVCGFRGSSGLFLFCLYGVLLLTLDIYLGSSSKVCLDCGKKSWLVRLKVKWDWGNFVSQPGGGILWFHWRVGGGSAHCRSVKIATWPVSIVPLRTRGARTGFAVVHCNAADVTQCAGWLFDSVWGPTGPSLWLQELFLALHSPLHPRPAAQ